MSQNSDAFDKLWIEMLKKTNSKASAETLFDALLLRHIGLIDYLTESKTELGNLYEQYKMMIVLKGLKD